MTIDPEKQTRYWRSRTSYPRPSAGKIQHGSGELDTEESNSPFGHEVQQAKALASRAVIKPPRRHQPTDWTPSSTREQDLEPLSKRSITWNPNRPRPSRGSTRTNVPSTTLPSDDFHRPSPSGKTDSDVSLDLRSPCFNPAQHKPTAVDSSHPPLYNTRDDSVTTYFSLADSLKSPRLSAKTPRSRGQPDAEYLPSLGRCRAPPSPSPGFIVQWLAGVSTAAAPSHDPDSESERDAGGRRYDDENSSTGVRKRSVDAVSAFALSAVGDVTALPDRPSSQKMAVDRAGGWCQCVDCDPLQRSGTDEPRGPRLDAGTESRMEAASEKRAGRMGRLAVWLVVGLIGVWVLLMAANLKLAGYEAALESMHRR